MDDSMTKKIFGRYVNDCLLGFDEKRASTASFDIACLCQGARTILLAHLEYTSHKTRLCKLNNVLDG